MPFKYACELEGIGESTGHAWMLRGEAAANPPAELPKGYDPKTEAIYLEFSRAVTRARARGVKKLVEQSLAGGKGSAAAQFHLERRHREEYAPTNRFEHAGANGGPIESKVDVDITKVPDEELRRIAAGK